MSADTGPDSRADKSSRRSFFTCGGAALGVGLATTVTGGALAAAGVPPQADPPADSPAERESLRQLQLSFNGHIESGRHEEAADLFAPQAILTLGGETARGRSAIGALLARQARQELPVLHRAYRQSPVQQQRDTVTIGSGGHATATFHVDVELCRPLAADCTAARMALLQGGLAERRWEAGTLDAAYRKTAGRWQITSLRYHPV
jgi:hypothetical protein